MSNGQSSARSQKRPPADPPKPKRKLTKAEVEEQLRRRSASIDGHVEGLKKELKGSPAAAQRAAQEGTQHALRQYAAAVMGGLGLVGTLLGYGLTRRRLRKRRAAAERTWLDDYRDAVREDVRAAARRGEDPGEAASRILEGHRPLVVREGAAGTSKGGLLRTVASLATRTLLSVAVKYAIDLAASQQQQSQLPPGATRSEPVEGATGEGERL